MARDYKYDNGLNEEFGNTTVDSTDLSDISQMMGFNLVCYNSVGEILQRADHLEIWPTAYLLMADNHIKPLFKVEALNLHFGESFIKEYL